MPTNREWIQLYIDEVGSKYAKDIKVRPKSESALLKLLAPIVKLFNEQFMKSFVTTIGNTIWVPDGWQDEGDPKSRLQTIAHEVLHIKQSAEQSHFIHGFLYLFPQSLAAFSLLSLLAIPFGLGWLWCLLFLLCLAPLPAPFRYHKELEAYRVRILFFKHVYTSNEELFKWAKDLIVLNMTKSNYYFAWPFPKFVRKDLDDETALDKKQYKEIVNFLERHNLTVK